MIDQYIANDTDNWGSLYNSSSNTYQPNYELVNQYMNNIVGSSSDFVCANSILCDTITYKASNADQMCTISCGVFNDSCNTDTSVSSFVCLHLFHIQDKFFLILSITNKSGYYITNTMSGNSAETMTQQQANGQCKELFGSSLASLHTDQDLSTIWKMMNDLNVDQCWIGFNNTMTIFELNNHTYHEWIDSSINAYNNNVDISANDPNTPCVSISADGDWIFSDCDETKLSCSICNIKDDPLVVISDDSLV